MEEITQMLKKIQDEMKQQKIEITKSINDNINEKFQNLEIRSAKLESKVEKQSQIIQNFDKILRRRNLVFFGIEEVEKGYHDMERIILGIINKNMTTPCDTNNIEYVKRIGKKEPEKTRPVIVTFTTMGKKIEILKKKKNLDSTSYYIKQDFPPEVLEKRKELQKKVDEERKQGRNAVLRYDKVIYLKGTPNNPSKYTKRTINSPENSAKPHVAKKNKVDLQKFIARKPRTTNNQTDSDRNYSETD